MGEVVLVSNGCGGVGGGGGSPGEGKAEGQQQGQLLALVLAALRKSVVLPCQMADADDPAAGGGWGMEISWPTDVRHVAHVTFDRLNGFLGLPVEFELEIPGHVPSASASVFGVSPESMQCGYDDKGNSMPKILLLMQERLYTQDGLKAEGIFRITPENSQEEHVREQLNRGVVPDDIDVHCLASLIKAWFRELPVGVLDSLSPEQVLHCNTEEKCVELVKLLPPTQTALLSWVVELMADVVEEEESNKMNARNVAMVFAPNMTQMSDPLTALMHAVQVMNFLKTLILKTLREREDDDEGSYSTFSSSPTLCDELDEVNHHDQQDDENDRDFEKYSGGGSESPKDIDKAAKPEVDNEQLIGASRRHTSIDFHLCDELDEVNHHDQQDDENDRDIEKYSGGGSESLKDIDKAAKPEVDNEQLIGASRRHTSIDFHLCDELDEVNHHDQQDDENDRDIEKYSGGGSESLKDIDKAAKPEVDNEQLIGASRRHTSIDFHLPYISYSSDDKDVPLNDIEECFLRRLESKAVSKGADENNGSNLVTSNKAAEQLSSSESINGSCKRNDQTSNMKDAVDTKSNEVKDVTKGE